MFYDVIILSSVRRVPFVLALLLLVTAFSLRNEIAVGPVTGVVEQLLSERLGVPVEVEIEALEGSWITEFAVEGLSIVGPRGVLHSFEASRLEISYHLSRFLSSRPVSALEAVTLSGAELTLREESLLALIQQQRLPAEPGELLAQFLSEAPRALQVDLSSSFLLLAEDGAVTVGAQLRLQGALGTKVDSQGVAVDARLLENEYLPIPGRVASSFYLRATENALEILPAREQMEMVQDARNLGLSGTLSLLQGSEELSTLRLQASAGPVELMLLATPSSATAAVAMEHSSGERVLLPEQWSREVVQDPVALGAASLRATLTRAENVGASVLKMLLVSPKEAGELGTVAFDARLEDSRLGNLETLSANLEGTIRENKLNLGHLELLAADAVLTGKGNLDLQTGALREGSVSAEVPSVSVLRRALLPTAAWAEQLSGRFTLQSELQGNLYADSPRELLRSLSGTVEINAATFRVAGLSLDRVLLSARLRESTVQVDRLIVERGELAISTRSTLVLEPKGERVEVQDAQITLPGEPPQRFTLASPTTVAFSPEAVEVAETALRSPAGQIRLAGRLDSQGVHAELFGSGLSPTGLAEPLGLPGELTGAVSIRGSLDGALDNPRVYLAIESDELTYRGKAASVAVTLLQEDRGVELRNLELLFGTELTVEGSGTLPVALSGQGVELLNLRSAALTLSAVHSAPGALLPEEFAAYLPTERATLEAELREKSGDLRVELSALVRGEEPDGEPSTLRFSLGLTELPDDQLRLRGRGRLDETEVVRGEGRLRIPGLSVAQPTLAPEKISVAGESEIHLPLDFLAERVPALIFAGGLLDGEIAVSGKINAIEVTGNASIRRAELRLAGPLPPVTLLSTSFELTEEEVRITRLTGELGRSPFFGSGTVELPIRGRPGALNLLFSGEELLLYSDPTLRVRSDAVIELTGSLWAPRITGNLTVQDAQYEENLPLINLNSPPAIDPEALQLFSFRGSWAEASTLDVDVEADRTILVRNNLLDTRLSLDLHLGGTMQVPVMTGRVFSQEAALRLPLTTVDLSQMVVTFPTADPFQPTLEARGRSQVRGYELILRASGQLSAVEVEVSSSPPLPQEQALLLLATGYADVGDLGPGERTVRALGRFLGRQLLEVLLAETAAEDDVTERVEVAIGREMSTTGAEVIEVEYRLSDGERWFLQFERDRFDEYNLGVSWRLWFN